MKTTIYRNTAIALFFLLFVNLLPAFADQNDDGQRLLRWGKRNHPSATRLQLPPDPRPRETKDPFVDGGIILESTEASQLFNNDSQESSADKPQITSMTPSTCDLSKSCNQITVQGTNFYNPEVYIAVTNPENGNVLIIKYTIFDYLSPETLVVHFNGKDLPAFTASFLVHNKVTKAKSNIMSVNFLAYNPYTYENLKTGNFDGTLQCIYTSTEKYYTDYTNYFPNKVPIMFSVDLSLYNSHSSNIADSVALMKYDLDHTKGIPVISIYWTEPDPMGLGIPHDLEIINGDKKDVLEAFGDMFHQYHLEHKGVDPNNPDGVIFIIPGKEANAPMYNYNPDYFADAFRTVVDTLKSKAPENIVVAWVLIAVGDLVSWEKLYPGDAYADWVGADLFASIIQPYGKSKTNYFIKKFSEEKSVVLPSGLSAKRPFLTAESGPNANLEPPYDLDMQDPETWDKWFVPYFDIMENKGKAFCYSSVNYAEVGAEPEWGDFQIQNAHPDIIQHWIDKLNQPNIISVPQP